MPKGFPLNSLQLIRILRAIQDKYPARLEACSLTLWEAFFIHETGKELEKPDGVARHLQQHFTAEELRQLLKDAQSAENKARVKDEAKVSISAVPLAYVQHADT